MKGIAESIVVAILLITTLGLAGIVYTFLNANYASSLKTVEVIDAYCVNGTAYFVIRNGGAVDLTKASFVCAKTNSGCSGECVVDDIFPAGGAGYVKAYDCDSGTHTFSLSVGSNSLSLLVYCK